MVAKTASGPNKRGFLSMRNYLKIGAVSLIALAAAGGPAVAAENVFGDIGFNTNTHFVSYGLDVWGAGNSFYGNRMTNSIYGDLGVKITPELTWLLNAWTDLNTNAAPSLGGSLQELDINTGFAYTFGGGFTGSVMYGAWSYAGSVEEIVDVALSYDDTGLIFEGVGFMPKVTWHNRTAGNGAQATGSAVVVSVGPSFPLGESGVTLSVPAGMAFFNESNFQGGTSGGLSYGYIGGSLGMPLSFVPSEYGAWSANFDLIGYFTKPSAIPANPRADFLTGSFNIKMAF